METENFKIKRIIDFLNIMIFTACKSNRNYHIIHNSAAADEMLLLDSNELDLVRSEINESWCYNAHDDGVYVWKK